MTPISPSLLYPRRTAVAFDKRRFFLLVLFPRLLSSLFFFGKSLPVNSRPLGAIRRDRSMENSLEERYLRVSVVVTRIVED